MLKKHTGGEPLDINNNMKLIYLLLKQHKVTKKFYLCKRVTSNFKSVFTYKGSGKRWLNHLKKHGMHIDTSILYITQSIEQFKAIAQVYNEFWNVGNNKNFLNLRPECGDGGDTWSFFTEKEMRKQKISQSLKQFHNTDAGKKIRKQVGLHTSKLQKGKTMKERLGDNYIDKRAGKEWTDIYGDAYSHPQQKQFKIQCELKSWVFKNERDFAETLNIHPDPILRILKRVGVFTFKQNRKNAKHSFKRGDVLIFEWM